MLGLLGILNAGLLIMIIIIVMISHDDVDLQTRY